MKCLSPFLISGRRIRARKAMDAGRWRAGGRQRGSGEGSGSISGRIGMRARAGLLGFIQVSTGD